MTRKKNTKFVAVLSALITILLIQSSVFACLCGNISVKKRVRLMKKTADAIFTGTVKEIARQDDLGQGRVKVTLVVTRMWKGTNDEEYNVSTGGGCAVYFEKGREYVVYAKQDGTANLVTDVCMGTGDIRLAQEDFKYLGKPVFQK